MHSLDRRGASALVLTAVIVGVIGGVVWAWLAARASGPASIDLAYGAVALVAGLVVGVVAVTRRALSLSLVAIVVLSVVLGAAAEWASGVVLGAPGVRAWAVLLAWPIGALVVVVGAGISERGEVAVSGDDLSAPPPPSTG